MIELSEMQVKPLSQKYVNAGISMTVSMLQTIDRLRNPDICRSKYVQRLLEKALKEEIEKDG
jgi:hypothetical protein